MTDHQGPDPSPVGAAPCREAAEGGPASVAPVCDADHRDVLAGTDLGFCIVELVFDAAGRPADFRYVAVNPAFARQTGLHGAVGRTARELAPNREADWSEQYGQVALTGVPARFEARAPGLGGRWFDVHAVRIGAPERRRVGVLLSDITGHKQAEAALRASEARLRLATEGEGLGVWEVDLETGRGIRSAEAAALLGETGTVFDAHRWTEAIHPDDRPATTAAWRRAIKEGAAYEVEYRTLAPAPDGGERWLLARAGVERDPVTGRAVRAAGVLFDVTRRHRADEHRELLLHELNHRVKNMLATVQSIANQTLRAGTGPQALAAFQGRLLALGRANDLLTRENWDGALLEDVARLALAPHRDGHRIAVDGPPVRLPTRSALGLAMALHELATNALKYGALSVPQGSIALSWSRGEGGLRLAWREQGGPPVAAPRRSGFGSRMLQRGLAHELGGVVRLDYAPDGLVCEITLPSPRVAPESRRESAAPAAGAASAPSRFPAGGSEAP